MFLSFDIVDVGALDAGKRWLVCLWERRELWMFGEDLT
jgi:hypothetical protein